LALSPRKIVLPNALEEVVRFADLPRLINRHNIAKDDIVYLSLEKVPFMSPYGLLGLLLIGKDIYEVTQRKSYIYARKDKLIKYLERMDFFEIGKAWFNRPNILDKPYYKFSRDAQTKNLLEIQQIGSNVDIGKFQVDSIVTKFGKRASAILQSFEKRMDVNSFIKVMAELCTNVYTHSLSDGYVAIQRYNYEKRGFQVVKLAVMDDGIGIKSSLEKRYKYGFQNESEYLKMALEPNISGAGDRGFGLCEVKSIVEKSQGYLWINSGGAAILIEPHGKKARFREYINLPLLRGTRIAIILAFGKITFSIDTAVDENLYS